MNYLDWEINWYENELSFWEKILKSSVENALDSGIEAIELEVLWLRYNKYKDQIRDSFYNELKEKVIEIIVKDILLTFDWKKWEFKLEKDILWLDIIRFHEEKNIFSYRTKYNYKYAKSAEKFWINTNEVISIINKIVELRNNLWQEQYFSDQLDIAIEKKEILEFAKKYFLKLWIDKQKYLINELKLKWLIELFIYWKDIENISQEVLDSLWVDKLYAISQNNQWELIIAKYFPKFSLVIQTDLLELLDKNIIINLLVRYKDLWELFKKMSVNKILEILNTTTLYNIAIFSDLLNSLDTKEFNKLLLNNIDRSFEYYLWILNYNLINQEQEKFIVEKINDKQQAVKIIKYLKYKKNILKIISFIEEEDILLILSDKEAKINPIVDLLLVKLIKNTKYAYLIFTSNFTGISLEAIKYLITILEQDDAYNLLLSIYTEDLDIQNLLVKRIFDDKIAKDILIKREDDGLLIDTKLFLAAKLNETEAYEVLLRDSNIKNDELDLLLSKKIKDTELANNIFTDKRLLFIWHSARLVLSKVLTSKQAYELFFHWYRDHNDEVNLSIASKITDYQDAKSLLENKSIEMSSNVKKYLKTLITK